MPRSIAPVVYVDSCVYMDLLAKNETAHPDSGEPRWKIAKSLFDAVNDGRVTLAASALIDVEVCCLGVVRDGSAPITDAIRGWFNAPATAWTDIDRPLAREAAVIAREWHPKRAAAKAKLGGADATHLAAAVRLGCDYLMTHDEGFPLGHTVKTVQVVRPQEVWAKHLFDQLDEN